MNIEHLPKVIGLIGYAGAGKSTVADILVDNFGYKRIKYAAPLKDMMRALGLNDCHIEGALKEIPNELLGGKTPRQAMQWLGTEWGRNFFGPDFWVNIAREKALEEIGNGGRVVIDDVRFQNEADMIRNAGGVVIKVERPGFKPVNSHISDNVQLEDDGIIYNSSTISMLGDAVHLMMELIGDSANRPVGVYAKLAQAVV